MRVVCSFWIYTFHQSTPLRFVYDLIYCLYRIFLLLHYVHLEQDSLNISFRVGLYL